MPPPSGKVKRRFQPVKAEALGYESGKTRFTNKDGDLVPPAICPWRNNLTALSQRYNLYFVASREKIHVYVPQFYTQSLGGKPSLILSPPPAQPDSRGYIDERHPHTVNHLIVGDLGADEVLVLATDTGNVAAYHTGAIERVLDQGIHKATQAGVDDGGIRPFFTHWVFESAWGLTIHKAARLIAVSANVANRVQSTEHTAKITVFAFALSSSSENEAEDEETSYVETDLNSTEADDWLEIEDREVLRHQLGLRDRNLKITLSEHGANVPNIAFVNNHYDRHGRFLFSTDIDGEMKLWRIWDREVLRSYDFSEYSYGARSRRRDRTDMGWNVIPLDPATFYTTSSMEEFCGEINPSEYFPSISGAFIGGPRESYYLNGHAGRSRFFPGLPIDNDNEDDLWSDDDISGEAVEDEDDEVGGVSLLASQPDEDDTDGDDSNDFASPRDRAFDGEVAEVDAIVEDSNEILEEGISAEIADRIFDRIAQGERRNESFGNSDL